MKRLSTSVLVLGLFVLIAPAATRAKGASEATISGPGLAGPITMAGEGQAGGEQLMQLAEYAGFFPAVFRRTPNPMLEERPRGELGPAYTIEYTMPGPNNELDVLRQELYPYAEPDPVTYMEPGQGFFGTEETVGGWFVAGSVLTDALVAVGLPKGTPTAVGGTGDGERAWTILVGVIVALCLGVAAVLLGLARRRSTPAPA